MYYRVKVDGKSHDIDINNCKIITRWTHKKQERSQKKLK
jgi:hypothetical protein